MTPDVTIRASSMVHECCLRIKVKGVGIATARLKVSAWMFRLAAFVAGTKSEISMELVPDEKG